MFLDKASELILSDFSCEASAASVFGQPSVELLEPRLLLSGAAPTLDNPLADQYTLEDAAFMYVMPANTFSDPEMDPLSYQATLADDSELPDWLNFNAENQVFSGTPGNADVGAIAIKLTASDGAGQTSDEFVLNVINVAPVLTIQAPIMRPVAKASAGNMGQCVSEVIYNAGDEPDAGMAIVSASASLNGSWQYSLDAGQTWTTIAGVSESNALLLEASARIRFAPNGDGVGAETVGYRLWDSTTGTAGAYADVTVNGAATAFSSSSDAATLQVVNEKADAIDQLRGGYIGLYWHTDCEELRLQITSGGDLITLDPTNTAAGYTHLTAAQISDILGGTQDMTIFEIPFMEEMAKSGMNTLMLKVFLNHFDDEHQAVFNIIKYQADQLGLDLNINMSFWDYSVDDVIDLEEFYTFTYQGNTNVTNGPSPYDGWGTSYYGVWDYLIERIEYLAENDLADAIAIDWELYNTKYQNPANPSDPEDRLSMSAWVVPCECPSCSSLSEDDRFFIAYEIGLAVRTAAGDLRLSGLNGDYFLSQPSYYNTYLGFMAGMQTDEDAYTLFTERTYNGEYRSINDAYRLTFAGYELKLEEMWDRYDYYFQGQGLNVDVVSGLWLGTNTGIEVNYEVNWTNAGEDGAIDLLVEYGLSGGYWIYGMRHLADDPFVALGPWDTIAEGWAGIAEVNSRLDHALTLEMNAGQLATEITHDAGLGEWTSSTTDTATTDPVQWVDPSDLSKGFRVDVDAGVKSYVSLSNWGGLAPGERVAFSWNFTLDENIDVDQLSTGTDVLEVYIGGECIVYLQVRKVTPAVGDAYASLRARTDSESGLTADYAYNELIPGQTYRVVVMLTRSSSEEAEDGRIVVLVDGDVVARHADIDNYDELAGATSLLYLGRIWNSNVPFAAAYDDFKVSFGDKSSQGASLALTLADLYTPLVFDENDLLADNPALPGSGITYTLVSAPAKGDLYYLDATSQWVLLSASATFTQADLSGERIKFVPDSSASWSVNNWDSFVVEIGDANGNALPSTRVVVTLDESNSPPVLAGQQEFALPHTLEADTLVGTVAYTDADAGDSHTFSIVGGDQAGMFYVNSNGQIKLVGGATAISATTPVYVLTVEIRDSSGFTDRTQVRISGNAPGAVERSYTMNEDCVMGHGMNSTGVEQGELFTFYVLEYPTHGVFIHSDPHSGHFDYTPDPDWYGQDYFTFKINDGILDSNHATCVINVNSRNDVPVVDNPVADQAASVGVPFSFIFGADTFSDIDGDILTYSATLDDDSPLPAWLTLTSATRTFAGTPVTTGTWHIKLTANDGHNGLTSLVFDLVVS